MRDNRTDYIGFSAILIGLTVVFAGLGYPTWVFPATVFMGSIIFFMYLKSNEMGEKHHVNDLKQKAIKEEIQETYNARITYRVIKGLLNILPSPYILIDRNGRITFINSEAKGIVPDFHAGSHISNVFRSPIFLAAVADFKIDKQSTRKIKNKNLTINLEKNVDILNYVSNHNSMRPKLVIGFAAETDHVDKNANIKLMSKNCDWIIANDISKKESGFNSDYNEVTIHYKNPRFKKEKLSLKKKSEISEEIVDRITAQIY